MPRCPNRNRPDQEGALGFPTTDETTAGGSCHRLLLDQTAADLLHFKQVVGSQGPVNRLWRHHGALPLAMHGAEVAHRAPRVEMTFGVAVPRLNPLVHSAADDAVFRRLRHFKS